MDILAALLVLAGLTVSIAVLSWVYSKDKHVEKRCRDEGIEWLRSLRSFLEKIQKHRGLSTAYINGSAENLVDLKSLQSAIVDDVAHIESVGYWIRDNERWRLILEHWYRLEKNAINNADADNNLLQHNKMIQNTLYLIEEMADDHSLFQLCAQQQKSIEFLWQDLLHAIEYLGQARAIGSGIATKHKCSSVERIRMNYLYLKIEESCLSMNECLPNKTVAEKEVSSLLATIKEHILGSRCDITTRQYFARATQTIEFLYDQFDSTLAQVKKT